MKLIDKDAVVAEIDRLDEFYHISKSAGGQAVVESLLSFLDTLEVSEVDLKKEIKEHIQALPHTKTGTPNGWQLFWLEDEVIEIAKHFFKLGLKTQKGDNEIYEKENFYRFN